MLDIGWSEMALVALVALIVIGPKDLPKAMRSATKWIRKARSLAREFQSGVDDMVREADIEDARKAIQTPTNFDFDKAVEQTIDPTGEVLGEVKDVEKTAQSDGEAISDPPPDEASNNIMAPVEQINEPAATIETPPAEDDAETEAGSASSKRA